MYKQLRITHECIVLVLISLVNNERTNKIIKNSGIDSRWDTTKWRCICNIFNSKKMSFSFLGLWFVLRFLLLTTKAMRKRNETRFDTITVSLKAIWLVLGSVFLSLTSALDLRRTRVFFSYVWKMLAFSRYNLTASKLLSFSRFFGNNFCSNAFCGHRQLFGRFSRPASCSSLNSHLFVFLPVFCVLSVVTSV